MARNRPTKATLNEHERAVVLGARLVRRLWRYEGTHTQAELLRLLNAALLLSGHGDLLIVKKADDP